MEKNPLPPFVSLLFIFPNPQPFLLAPGSLAWSQSPCPARMHPIPLPAPWSQCTHTFAPSWCPGGTLASPTPLWCHPCPLPSPILLFQLLTLYQPSLLPSWYLYPSFSQAPHTLAINDTCNCSWPPVSNVSCFLCAQCPETSWQLPKYGKYRQGSLLPIPVPVSMTEGNTAMEPFEGVLHTCAGV